MVQQTLKLGPVPTAAGGFLLEQVGASGGAECGALLGEILALTRDAAVAQDCAGALLRRVYYPVSAVWSGSAGDLSEGRENLGVQSRHLLERIDNESFWLCCPGFADELVGCETFEGVQATAEIVSIDEVIKVRLG